MAPEMPFHIGWLDLLAAGALILVAVALSAWQRLGLGSRIVIGAVRATVQLVAVGYVLVWLFTADRWYLVLAVLAAMVVVATFTAAGRLARDRRERRLILPLAGAAILGGSALTLVYVSTVIVHVTPWYNPRYLIPLFGMIVANAMNAAAIALERLQSEMEARRGEVEAYLALGATPAQAAAEAVGKAIAAGVVPAINALAVVGVVSLPGMMTGQIIAGQAPTEAVRYQIVVTYMITAAVTVASLAAALWSYRQFFTREHQLLAE